METPSNAAAILKVVAHISNSETVITGDIPVEFWEALSLKMSYEVPGAFFSEAAKNGHWDGRKKLFNKRRLSFPTGLFSLFRETCNEFNIAYTLNDTRKAPTHGPRIDIKDIQLRDYQIESVTKALSRQRGMIRVATGGGKCITGDTLLFTEKGMITLDQIQNELKCAPEEAKVFELKLTSRDGVRTTSHFYNDGLRDTLQISTRMGYQIEGTFEHPLLVLDKTGETIFKKIKDLREGDVVCIQRGQNYWGNSTDTSDFSFVSTPHQKKHSTPPITPSLGSVLGHMVSVGYFSEDNCNFTNTDPEVVQDFISSIEEIFGFTPKKKDKISLDLNTDKVRAFFKYCGFLPNKSDKKEIPHRILQAPREVVKAFLASYFEGDGGIEFKGGNTGAISCTSKSAKLIKQIQVVLLNFGIISKRHTRQASATNGPNRVQEYYTLRITGENTRLFEKYIGFVSSKKIEKLRQITQAPVNANVDVIPVKHLFESLRSKHLAFTCTSKSQPSYAALQNPTSYDFFTSPKTSKKSLKTFTKWTNLDKIKKLLEVHYFFDTIVSIKNQKSIVYDFCVPETHNFTSNGFISHNTEILAEIIGRTNVPTLVLIHKQDIFHQLVERLDKRLRVPIGRVGCGIIEPERITVGMIQTVHRAYGGTLQGIKDHDPDATDVSNPELVQKTIENAECVLIDEAHHVSSTIYTKVMEKCEKAYYRFGVSASPWREDNADLLLDAHTGARCVDISASELIRRGYLSKPTVYLYTFDHGRPNAYGYPHMYEQQVVNNTFRNKIVVQTVLKALAANKTCLVAVTRIEHGRMLEAMLKAVVPSKIKFASGQISSEERKQILQDLNERKLKVVIATTVFGEGIDCPSLDVLINAKANKSSIDSLQLVGRALRKTATKDKVTIVDIYDDHCKYLGKHSKDRLKIYKTEPEFLVKQIKSPTELIFP